MTEPERAVYTVPVEVEPGGDVEAAIEQVKGQIRALAVEGYEPAWTVTQTPREDGGTEVVVEAR